MRFSRKIAWLDTTAWIHLIHRYLVNAVRGHNTGSNNIIFALLFSPSYVVVAQRVTCTIYGGT